MIINDKRELAYVVTIDEIKPIEGYDRVEYARTMAGGVSLAKMIISRSVISAYILKWTVSVMQKIPDSHSWISDTTRSRLRRCVRLSARVC